MRHVLLHETFQKCLKDKKCSIDFDLKVTIENLSSDKNLDDKEFLKALEGIDSSYSEIKNLREAFNNLSNKNSIFSRGYFNSLTDKSFRVITYDKVIANALLAGKLCCYYLACDEELFKTKRILKKTEKKYRRKIKIRF